MMNKIEIPVNKTAYFNMDEVYPVKITDEVYMNETRTEMAILDRSGEHMSELEYRNSFAFSQKPIYFAFRDDDAEKVRDAVKEILAVEPADDPNKVLLCQVTDDGSYWCERIHIVKSLFTYQDELRYMVPENSFRKDVFLLPLTGYICKCPVCGKRTLDSRGAFEICVECGWEDDGSDEDDNLSGMGANGDVTIPEYRAEYLKKKDFDPNYQWFSDVQREREQLPVLVLASHGLVNREAAIKILDKVLPEFHHYSILSEHTDGLISIGEEYAAKRGKSVTVFAPDTEKYGKAADKILIWQMLDKAAHVVAIWQDDGIGTMDVLCQAQQKGIPCTVLCFKTREPEEAMRIDYRYDWLSIDEGCAGVSGQSRVDA